MSHFLSRIFRSGPNVTRVNHRDRRANLSLEALEFRLAPADFTVTNPGDAGAGNGNSGDLRYCITKADASTDPTNTIAFQAGVTGTITLGTALPDISKNVTITGPGFTELTVERDPNAMQNFRIFTVDKGVTAEIDDMTMMGGVVAGVNGGGVLNSGTLTLTSDVINGNTANRGSGGGIANDLNAKLTLSDTWVENNSAGFGGGIANFGTLTMCCSSEVLLNTASQSGGGISNVGKATLSTSTQIFNNTATLNGGGVYNLGFFTMHGGVISDNTANMGGGLYTSTGGVVTLDSGVTVNGNAANQGGALYLGNGTTTSLDTVTIQNNILLPGGTGKGIYEQNGATLNQTNVTNSDGLVQGP